jgi:transposase
MTSTPSAVGAISGSAPASAVNVLARSLDMTRQSVNNWVRRYRHDGKPATLADAPESGRLRKADDAVEALLQGLMIVSPERCGYHATHWTVPLLTDQVRKNLGTACSELTIRRCLRRLGYVWKRPRYVLAPDPQREKKRPIRCALGKSVERRVVLVEDETDLQLFPPLRAMWSPRGEPARGMLSGKNARRVVFGCMNLATGHRLFLAQRRQRAEEFQAFLRLVRRQYRGWRITMVLDGDRSHDAHASQKLAAQLDLQLLWRPKRAPELNPMDTLWGQGKDAICANKQFTSIDEQVASFIEHVSGMSNPEALHTAGVLSEHFWLRRVLEKN